MALLVLRIFFVSITAGVGYSVGGTIVSACFGFGIGLAFVLFEVFARNVSLKGLSSAVFGVLLGLLLSKVFSEALKIFQIPSDIADTVTKFVTFIFIYLGLTLGIKGKGEFNVIIPYVKFKRQELKEESDIAKYLKVLLDTIPDVAESQLRPHIRTEARSLFREIFGDRYSDLVIDDDYEIALYDLQGNRVSLMAASGGEDVCVNFALRVAVNTALQKHSITGPPPGLIVLDEPGAGLDTQRRRWLPEAIARLDVVDQVLVVTHMEELKGSTDHIISLIPQGKGRQPLVEVD